MKLGEQRRKLKTRNLWGNNKKNKILNKIIFKALYIIVIILITYNALYIINNALYLKKYVSIFGKIFITTQKDNSMKTDINKNDFIVLYKVKYNEIKNNDIISYDINNEITLRKVVDIEQKNGQYYYETKANNYYHNDLEKKTIDQINGKILFKIPFIGFIFRGFENKIVTIIIVIILLLRLSFNKYVQSRNKKMNKYKNKKK